MSVGRFVQRLYQTPDRVAERRDAFLSGEGPAPLTDPVQWCELLGLDPDTFPEAVEQIRRDRDRLIDVVRD